MFGVTALALLVHPIKSQCDYKPSPVCLQQEVNYTELIISRLESHDRIVYRLGCDGQYPCRSNGFDCSGLITDARRHAGYYDGRKLNSSAIYQGGDPIHYTETKRGDYLYFNRVVGDGPDHIAIVTRGRDGETIEIMDNFEKPGYVTKRLIKIFGNSMYTRQLQVNAMRLDYSLHIGMNKKGNIYRF